MHETSIAYKIVEIVNESVNTSKRLNVKEVRLKIGILSNINVEALASAFQITVMDSDLSKTELSIETLPVVLECNNCKKILSTQEFIFTCPNCSSSNIEVRSGDELEISEIILDT